jgi:hypothetical protein
MHKEVVGQGTQENWLYTMQCNTKLNKKECIQVINLGESDTKLSAKECVQVIGCR